MRRALALTLVNALSVSRFLAAWYVGAYWAAGQVETASWLLVAGTVSDWLDGPLARRWQVTTRFGFWLDMVGDRILLLAPFVGQAAAGALPLWAVGAMVAMFELRAISWRFFSHCLDAKNNAARRCLRWTGNPR